MATNCHNPVSKRYIQRYQTGYRVKIRVGKDLLTLEHFPFTEFGGIRKAFAAAKAWRDDFVKAHNIPLREYDGNGFYLGARAGQDSNVVGLILAPDSRDEPGYVAWGATFVKNGKQQHAYRSIRKFGYAGAWREARKIRMKHTGCDIPEDPPPPPKWLKKWISENGIAVDN